MKLRLNTVHPLQSGALRVFLLLLALSGVAACSTLPPQGISPVSPFDLDRYKGKWFELARLDHSFERGLSDVSATYRQLSDGSVEVVNRGYDANSGKWREATGRARFLGSPQQGALEVSFFGPFYGGYHVVALDQLHYRWAVVMGSGRDYLWILSRDRHISPALRANLLRRVSELGVKVDSLIWVAQEREES